MLRERKAQVMFKNLKIASKLIVGFSLAGGSIILVGMVGINGLKSVRQTAGALFNVSVKPLATLNNMANDFAALRGVSREMLDPGGPEVQAQRAQDLRALEADLAQASDTFGASAVHADMKQIYGEFAEGLKEFESDLAQESELLKQRKNREALELVQGSKMRDERARVQEAIRKLANLKLEKAQERADSALKESSQATRTMFVVMLVALMASLAAGVWIAG